MGLSDQAIAAVMVALQRCILEQSDVTEILRGFKLQFNEENETLIVLNPPDTITLPESGPEDIDIEQNCTVGSD